MTELKRCPFCGGKAKYKRTTIKTNGVWCDTVCVRCISCDSRTGRILYDARNTPTVKNTKKRRKLGTGGLTMARYFKITEIDCDSFFQCTGEELDCSQLVVPVIGYVLVAVDDTDEDEISVPLDSFDEED